MRVFRDVTKSGISLKPGARKRGWATLAIVIVLPLLFAPSAQATEIVAGSWTGILERHTDTTMDYPYNYQSWHEDVTVSFQGTADVSTHDGGVDGQYVGGESEGLFWDADAAWSAHLDATGHWGGSGGCPWTAELDIAGTSRTATVEFVRRSALLNPPPGDSVWVYSVSHDGNEGGWVPGEFGPPCSHPFNGIPGGPTIESIAGNSNYEPLPDGPGTTTLSGTFPFTIDGGNGLVITRVNSWQLTREPDEDCDGIPDSQDALSTLPGCGSDGADAACEEAKKKVKKAKEKLERADTAREKAKAKRKLKKAKEKREEACG